MNALDYLGQFFRLLPKGRAWRVTPDTVMGKLLAAFAEGAAAFDQRLLDLIEEADPRTTTEMVDAWERFVGLPDGCTGALTDIDDRRAAIWQKLTSQGGQSRSYFIEVAARLGYVVTIQVFEPLYCTGLCDGTVFDESWRFVWQVTVAGADSAPVLECVLSRLRPAETVVFFTYEGV